MPSQSSAIAATNALSSPFAIVIHRAEGPFDIAAELCEARFSSFAEAEAALIPIAEEANLHSGENQVLITVEHVDSNTRFTLRVDIEAMPVTLEKRVREQLAFMTTEAAEQHLRKLHGNAKANNMLANAQSWHRLLSRTHMMREESLRSVRRNGSLHRALALASEAVTLMRSIARSLDERNTTMNAMDYTDLTEAMQAYYRAADHYAVFCSSAAPGDARRAYSSASKLTKLASKHITPASAAAAKRDAAICAAASMYVQYTQQYAEVVRGTRGDHEYGTWIATYAELASTIAQRCS